MSGTRALPEPVGGQARVQEPELATLVAEEGCTVQEMGELGVGGREG